ncbi:MAG: ribosome rescue protein RqcH, partial [Candidatus Bathyarchaeia archaeon]
MRKKEFTSFDVAATVRELKETILDSRISNVYQLNNKTLLLKLHKPDNPDLRLILEAGRRLHLTTYVEEKPLAPPAFCMALRKYMRNSWLTDVEQYEFERVVIFNVKSKLGNLQLVLELFGEGNIILVDENGVILQALTYKRMRDRNIIRGEKFAFAPPSGKNPFKISREEFTNAIFGFREVEVVRALARLLGIGGLYAEEVLLMANVEKTKLCNTLNQSEVNALFDCLQLLLSRILSGKLEPCIVLDDSGEFLDVTPFKLRRYEAFKHHVYNTFNTALDEFYVRTTAVEKALAGVEIETLKREAERLQRIIESQERVFAEAEAKAERDRNIGDAIYMHAHELQALINRFLNEKKSGKEWKSIISEILAEKKAGLKPSLFFESFDAEGLVINVFVDGLRFGLGLRDKIFDVASQFYERSKKSKQKLEGAKAALEETRKQLAEVEAKIREVEALERAKPAKLVEEITKRKIKPKEWFEKFRWFISSDGFLIVAGKDAVSNEV